MKNNLFVLFAALVIFALVLVGATLMYLSKTSEYSRASDAPASSQSAN
ncbi:MAG: hypothetical protein V4727_04835 [Verrucomicrobiota bacterium]